LTCKSKGNEVACKINQVTDIDVRNCVANRAAKIFRDYKTVTALSLGGKSYEKSSYASACCGARCCLFCSGAGFGLIVTEGITTDITTTGTYYRYRTWVIGVNARAGYYRYW
jgi:hypothetical protein